MSSDAAAAAPRAPRPTIIGPDTANIPVTGVPWIEGAESGVYFGYASLHLPASHPDLSSSSSNNWRTFPMVMSIGYNPFYKNTVRSAEVHVLHSFATDFYGSWMRVSVSGFIRRELDYVDVESLIRDIRVDCEVARRSLEREAWGPGKEEKWLEGEGWSESESRSGVKSSGESKV
ncbi:Riboflavin kinase [Lachnellula willkommii]|uniref:Riboflavin kinase n=1 Tax=Lachnellula willkommii TaxID=215461 RepID=A0A559MIX6_9HELO|nr:Riboflavin kinase [Lachnellula willkommii]